MPPRSPEMASASAADFAACREAIRTGSRSFHAASVLLPEAVRQPAFALYAFCRLSDDAVDIDSNEGAVGRLRDRLGRIYAGEPSDAPADRAFAEVVSRYSLPRALPEAMLEGFAWDVAERRYETVEDLRAYAARVAGTVGAMMAVLMGRREPEVLARACDLGVAMQFTNIARDVGEDARAGRLYLPCEWLREEGLDPDAWLERPEHCPGIASAIRRLLDEADILYRRSVSGIGRLPRACRPAIHAARLIYAEIGREVAMRDHDSISDRAVVSTPRKVALLARALGATVLPSGSASIPSLAETRFLVDAVVAAHPSAAGAVASIPWWNLYEQMVRTIDLIEKLERRDRPETNDSVGQQAG